VSRADPEASREDSARTAPDAALAELQELIDLGPTDRTGLERTVVLCRTVLPLIDKAGNPDGWAIVQTTLGNALSALGELLAIGGSSQTRSWLFARPLT
jgi:hypothetical protein